MTRKKVKLEFIVNDSSRKASFRKRKLGLLKKMEELTTLCGIQAVAIIYSPYEKEPTTYPSDPDAVRELLDRFMNMPEIERSKKMLTQETYMKERAKKNRELIKKQIRKNQELQMDNTMYQLRHGKQISEIETNELMNLFYMVKDKMDETARRIEYQQNYPEPADDLLQQDPNQVDDGDGDDNAYRVDVIDGENDEDRDLGGLDEWFIDMLMNNKAHDKAGGSTSSVRGELGFGTSDSRFDGFSERNGGEREGSGNINNIERNDEWFIDMVMNNNDHENSGRNTSSVRGELGFGTPHLGFDGYSERNGGEKEGSENINIEGNCEMGFCENGNFKGGNKESSINGGNDKDLEINNNGGKDDNVEGKNGEIDVNEDEDLQN